jgi:hypothetical protein
MKAPMIRVHRGLWVAVTWVGAVAMLSSPSCGASAPAAQPAATRAPAAASTPASAGFTAGGPAGEFPASANSLEGAVPPAPPDFDAPPGDPSDGRFVPPLTAWTALLDGFGEARRDGFIHGGLDFGLDGRASSPVRASCAGSVSASRSDDSYGLHATIDCGEGWTTLYGFLGSIQAKAGQGVARGAVIATSDSTGGKLHFQLAYNGVPVNPEEYVDFGTAPRPTPTPLPATPVPPSAAVTATATPRSGAATSVAATATASPTTPSSAATATRTPTRTPTATPTRRPPTPTPTSPPVFQQ